MLITLIASKGDFWWNKKNIFEQRKSHKNDCVACSTRKAFSGQQKDNSGNETSMSGNKNNIFGNESNILFNDHNSMYQLDR